ncbi:MAG: hypothetical protein ABIE46_03535 [Patescibacteria group bacterium]|nr:hypothetical protein [Patescibacteria group bacterium]
MAKKDVLTIEGIGQKTKKPKKGFNDLNPEDYKENAEQKKVSDERKKERNSKRVLKIPVKEVALKTKIEKPEEPTVPTLPIPEKADLEKGEIEIDESVFYKILKEIFNEYKGKKEGIEFNYFRDLLNDFKDNFFKKEKIKELKEKIKTELKEEAQSKGLKNYNLELLKDLIKEDIEKKLETLTPEKPSNPTPLTNKKADLENTRLTEELREIDIKLREIENSSNESTESFDLKEFLTLTIKKFELLREKNKASLQRTELLLLEAKTKKQKEELENKITILKSTEEYYKKTIEKTKKELEEEKLKEKEESEEEKIKKIIEECNIGLADETITPQDILEHLKQLVDDQEITIKQKIFILSEIKELMSEKLKPKETEEEKKIRIIRESILEETKKEEVAQKDKTIAHKLVEFGINLKDFKDINIDSYKSLSAGQILLILENLKQVTLSNIKERAGNNYKEDVSKSGFFGKIWKGMTKKDQIANAEKAEYKRIEKGGIEIYKDDLTQLIRGMMENQLNVIEKDGKLEIQYIDINDKKLNSEQKAEVNIFNKIATEFSMMPYEWSLETATKKQQADYKIALEEYENSKKTILNIENKTMESETKATLHMNDVDRKIQYNQFLTAHPEIEKELQKMTKGTTVFEKSLFGENKGYYVVAGWGARSIATKSLAMTLCGLVAIPAIASFIGGALARKRAKESIREKEIGGRRGEEQAKEILRLAEKRLKDLEKKRGSNKEKNATEKQIEEAKKRVEEAKIFINADSSEKDDTITKIKRLIGKIDAEENKDKKLVLINLLKARIEHTQNKIDDGLVNFGDEKSRLANQLNLIQALSKAEIATDNNIEYEKKKLGDRLNYLLKTREENIQKTEGKIEKAQKNYVNTQMIKGALMGAGFALVGWELRNLAGHWFGWDKNINPIKNTSDVHNAAKPIIVAGAINNAPGEHALSGVAPSNETSTQTFGQQPIVNATQEHINIIPNKNSVPLPEKIATPTQILSPEDTIIHKGQGIWNPIKEQLNNLMEKDPKAFAERFHLKPEDFDTPSEQKTILNKITMNLLAENKINGDKIINLDGKTEIRVFQGTRAILNEDNTISIINQNNAPVETYKTILGAHETTGAHTGHGATGGAHETTGAHTGHGATGGAHETTILTNEARTPEPRNILAELNEQANTPLKSVDLIYHNSHGLGMIGQDTDEHGVFGKIFIFDGHNKIIETLTPSKDQSLASFMKQAELTADAFIKDRTSVFEGIVKNSGITMEDAKLANIDIFTERKLPIDTQLKLDFWSKNIDMLPEPEITKNFFELSQDSGIKYNTSDFQIAFEKMPAGLNHSQEIGYAKIFAGTDDQRNDGLAKLFGQDLFGTENKISTFIKNGVLHINNAFGHKGYNILLSQDKIGVDGQGLLNWGTKGHFGKIHPINSLTPDMINEAKTKIEDFVKMMAEKPPINE